MSKASPSASNVSSKHEIHSQSNANYISFGKEPVEIIPKSATVNEFSLSATSNTQQQQQQTLRVISREKRNILTTEERELEQIKKEKKDLQKMKEQHLKCYSKSKKFTPLNLIPGSLTLIKPFNLSSSKSANYLKKRLTSTNFEIVKINEKIKNKIQDKIMTYSNTNRGGTNENVPRNIDRFNTNDYVTPNKIVHKALVDESMSWGKRIQKYSEITDQVLQNQEKDRKLIQGIKH